MKKLDKEIDELLDSDKEFIKAKNKLLDEYKFKPEELICFVNSCMRLTYIFAVIEDSAPETATPELDDDIMGALGIKMATQSVSELKTGKDGYIKIK